MKKQEIKIILERFIMDKVIIPSAGTENIEDYWNFDLKEASSPLQAKRNYDEWWKNNEDIEDKLDFEEYMFYEDSVFFYGCVGRSHTEWIDFNEIGINQKATVKELLMSIQNMINVNLEKYYNKGTLLYEQKCQDTRDEVYHCLYEINNDNVLIEDLLK